MDDILYNSLNNYFLTLSNLGYVKYNKVNNLLYLIAVQELTSSDYDGFLLEEDYRIIQNALYKIFGTSCVLSPADRGSIDTIYLDSSSRLATETERLKDMVEEVIKTKVVKTKDSSSVIEIDDIVL